MQDMTEPADVCELRTFLGFTQYLVMFLPNPSGITESMRQQTKQGAHWQWGVSQREAFLSTKAMMTTEPLLRYYRPEVELTIHCDTSDKGLGAALLQGSQPLAYSSRALTETEDAEPLRRNASSGLVCLEISPTHIWKAHCSILGPQVTGAYHD